MDLAAMLRWRRELKLVMLSKEVIVSDIFVARVEDALENVYGVKSRSGDWEDEDEITTEMAINPRDGGRGNGFV